MGTPTFASYMLEGLISSNHRVVGVVTVADKPAGRGQQLRESAVKETAKKASIPILQPSSLKDETFLAALQAFNADVFVVVAFRMLPTIIWKMPEYGTFNLHASLLPNYRGAAPINWAIINGETKTGVSTFFIDEKIDTGNIILQEEISISEDETVGELHDKLMTIGSELVVKTLKLISENTIVTTKQPEIEEKLAPKIFTETCKINWNASVNSIYNLIRGLNPYPTAWTTLINNNEEIKVKLFDVKKEVIQHSFTNGFILTSKNELKIAAKDGFIIVKSLQLAGKKKMDIKSLLNGFTFIENSYML